MDRAISVKRKSTVESTPRARRNYTFAFDMDQEMVYEANGEDLLKPRSAQMLRAEENPACPSRRAIWPDLSVSLTLAWPLSARALPASAKNRAATPLKSR